jgi:hypothetical protein
MCGLNCCKIFDSSAVEKKHHWLSVVCNYALMFFGIYNPRFLSPKKYSVKIPVHIIESLYKFIPERQLVVIGLL